MMSNIMTLRLSVYIKKLYNLNLNLSKMKSTGIYGFQIWSDCIVNFKQKNLKSSIRA